MNIDWSTMKDVFYSLGSLAGVIALSKPIFESKYDRDMVRFEYLSNIINEKMLINLEPCIWDSRRVPGDVFAAFDRVSYEVKDNIDELRFSGPLKHWYKKELTSICENYHELRKLIQVPEWEPYKDDSSEKKMYSWRFNKKFFTENGEYRPYDQHLFDATTKVILMKEAYQRMQIINEMHFYEFPLAKVLLPRRFNDVSKEET